ncbi:MAG: glycerophosphoryl diester phosphodiesterase membrane domain-containing protein [Ruminococcus sp.]|nr:glycerophosphoryl diester phosphodiesterase membrane domain-containing protein [Ruminococcus sp.]
MKRFFKFTGDFLRAAPKVLLFELIFKLLLTAIGAPLLSFLVDTAMDFSGIEYLSGANMIKFLMSPVTLGILLLLLFVVAFFSIVELSALTAGFAYIHERKKITAAEMFRCGIRAFGKAFRGTGILTFLGFMLIVPLAQFTMSSGIISLPVMPMLRALFGESAEVLCIIIFILMQLAITWLLAGRCYSLHYLVLTNHRFSECTAKSRSCLGGKKVRTFLTLILWSLLMILLAAAVTFGISFLIIFGIKGFSRPEAALVSSLRVLSYAGEVFIAISAILSAPFIIGCLTNKFFHDTMQEEEIILPELKEKKYPKAVKIIAFTAAAAVGVFLNFSYIREIYKGNVSFRVGIFDNTQVTAHRGFSYAAPENTMYAFEEAIRSGSDYIELDVQLTADGELVVFHDDTLDRTTDGTGRLSAYTYEELSELSCGEWFRKGGNDFTDAKIPLLSEVLEFAGENNTLLNVEIKKSGRTEETARKSAELIAEYGLSDSCYVTSFDYTALRAVKETDSEIKTGLIANIASPAMYTLRYIDAVSLNYVFVNKSIVGNAHKGGKRVFVWTVNSRDDMERMVSIGADNIITDRPDIASEVVYSYGKGDFVISLLEMLFGM